MPNSSLAFGIDISKYNTSADGRIKPDFDAIAAHQPEVVFIAMRAGISWGYQDPWFSYSFSEVTRINRVRMAYHVLYPGESPSAQMDNFFRILGKIDYESVPLVIDLELHHDQSVSTITRCTRDAVTILTQRTGRPPLIYSRAGFINQYLRVADLPPVYWWLAQYRWPRPFPLFTPEYESPPTLPGGVSDWTIHQTANRGASIGAKAMHYMDYNRWNGTKLDLYNFIGQACHDPLICPVDHQPCPRLFV
jgi:GH25 family lysozyme M1 (1,4-beta-N-acetylmuramidase)